MASDISSRFALGTAQIGMRYGIANATGKPGAEDAQRMLDSAWSAGIRCLDTAQNYGDAEAVIGEWHARHPDRRFRVITKMHPALDLSDATVVRREIEASGERLGVRPAGVLLHDPALLGRIGGSLGDALAAARASGATDAIGISVYTPEEFAAAIALPVVGIVQAPFNVFDRRIVEQGLVDKAVAAGKAVYLRSVFLQGLLTLAVEELPERMAFAAESVAEWRELCARRGLAPYPTAFKFAQQSVAEACLVVGCETEEQLARNVDVFNAPPLRQDDISAIARLTRAPDRMINPALWP